MVGGEDITDYDAKRLTRFRGERVGFVFQSVNLVPFLTAAIIVTHDTRMTHYCDRVVTITDGHLAA